MIRTHAASTLPWIGATLLVHLALVVLVVAGLSIEVRQPAEPQVMEVKLIPPTNGLLAPAPPPSAPASPPAPAHLEPKQSKPDRTIVAKRPPATSESRSAAPSNAPPRSRTPAVETSDAPTALPAAPATVSPAAPPAAPVKIDPSISATYAAGNRKPEYPTMSRRFQEEGTVTLRVLVKPDGSAGLVEIRTSSGFPLLDESAKNTVRTWRFNPATRDGRPIEEWYQVPIPFTLKD